jgi:hypothetical protein
MLPRWPVRSPFLDLHPSLGGRAAKPCKPRSEARVSKSKYEGLPMTSSKDWNTEMSGTVVAYFANGEDAQNSINELMDEGFPVSEIGAAFHGNTTPFVRKTGSPGRASRDKFPAKGATASGAGVAGAESDTSGVTPAGLSTGSGTGFAGASRPGPIPGSEIPETLRHETPSTLAPTYDYPYSSSAFESSFEAMGISREYSRRFAAEIRNGGAIVTVNAGSMIGHAEMILERNNGRIRYESASVADEAGETVSGRARVQIFGRVQPLYSGYVGSSERTRKAS